MLLDYQTTVMLATVAIATILSIIMTLISLYSANKVIEYKFQICHKVEMKNALKALRKNNEDLHKNINTPEKVRSNLLSDLIPIIEQIFRNDDVLKRQYKRCLKRVKKTDKITKENVQEFALEIDNIMKSLEKMYE